MSEEQKSVLSLSPSLFFTLTDGPPNVLGEEDALRAGTEGIFGHETDHCCCSQGTIILLLVAHYSHTFTAHHDVSQSQDH